MDQTVDDGTETQTDNIRFSYYIQTISGIIETSLVTNYVLVIRSDAGHLLRWFGGLYHFSKQQFNAIFQEPWAVVTYNRFQRTLCEIHDFHPEKYHN